MLRYSAGITNNYVTDFMVDQQVASSTQHNLEEVRAEANIILKVVDQYIKAGLLDEAKEHLDKARLIDPTNAYIYAFQERIAFLKEEALKKSAAASSRGAMEEAARAKYEEERRRVEMERQKKDAEIAKQREENRKKILETEKVHIEEHASTAATHTVQEQVTSKSSTEQTTPIPPEFQKFIDPTPAKKTGPSSTLKNEAVPVQRPESTTVHPESAGAVRPADQAYDMYKRVLLLAWADGALSPEEQSQLRDLRTTLRITAEEHNKLELEAQEESYAHAFTLVWTAGMSAKERSAVVNELRQKYVISPEAHSRIESRVLAEFGERQDKPKLYIIDDDEDTLEMIVRVLEGGGFAVTAYSTSDEALTGLKNDIPDLIVSDINLETSTIGGFSFYEKVRQYPHLTLVPFIFLSGMTDEGMVRYGKGLGADDYITKPFSGDMLIDTVKGKLKRYKQMKHK